MSDAKTYTQEELDTMVQEKLAEAKAEGDTAFQKLWNEAKTAKTRAKAFEGLNPDEVRERLERLAQLELESKAGKAGLTSEQLTKMREEVRADLAKEYEPFRVKAEDLGKQVRELRLDNVVKSEMGKHGVRADRVDALFRLSRDDFDLTDDGVPMIRERPGTEVGKYITDALATAYPEFFEGTGSSGGGASKPSGGAGGGARTIAADDSAAFLANLKGIAAGTTKVS